MEKVSFSCLNPIVKVLSLPVELIDDKAVIKP